MMEQPLHLYVNFNHLCPSCGKRLGFLQNIYVQSKKQRWNTQGPIPSTMSSHQLDNVKNEYKKNVTIYYSDFSLTSQLVLSNYAQGAGHWRTRPL